MEQENQTNKLVFESRFFPEGVEVRLLLNNYVDNNNLYIGLLSPSEDNPGEWDHFTDITINIETLPPFHGYIDTRDSNEGVDLFLMLNGIARPACKHLNGFGLYKFNEQKLKELVPEFFL